MTPSDIKKYLEFLDGRGSDAEYDAVRKLSMLGDEFPKLLLEKYRISKKWGERSSCVYHSIKYAQNSDSAFNLGLQALRDKSKHVRYRACMLLAVAQNVKALEALKELAVDPDSGPDALAAIDAIESENRDFFVDRDHSGMFTLNV